MSMRPSQPAADDNKPRQHGSREQQTDPARLCWRVHELGHRRFLHKQDRRQTSELVVTCLGLIIPLTWRHWWLIFQDWSSTDSDLSNPPCDHCSSLLSLGNSWSKHKYFAQLKPPASSQICFDADCSPQCARSLPLYQATSGASFCSAASSRPAGTDRTAGSVSGLTWIK